MINKSLHSEISLKKGDYFIKIGQVKSGVLRGFTISNDGEEIITHFFQEEDVISGNYIPNIPATMNIQALEDCILDIASYKSVFSQVNTDSDITKIILTKFQRLNQQNHSRLVVMIEGNSQVKYKWFLQEFPNLLNRIPHYYIANFLGMTPTQLSRARKLFSQRLK